MKLLLHACCAPCTLEPLRILAQEGHDITVSYNNSNIHPRSEYDKRLAVLVDYCQSQGIELVEGIYDPQSWARVAGVFGDNPETRQQRCRQCYRLRLEEAARFAATHGFEGLSTTLDVSPYQYIPVIEEELNRACQPWGLTAVFRDFTPYYPQATKLSRAMGMYRQNYCGCSLSDAEARCERQERAQQRKEQKERAAALRADQDKIAQEQRAEAARQKAAYQAKRAAQRAALKAYKQAQRTDQDF